MTDRELLELAAKAAGIEYDFCRPELGGCQIRKPFVSGFWNPLTDDGDAFRLAAAMGFSLEFGKIGRASLHRDGEWLGTATGSRRDGPVASMRSAIVILAAKQQQE
jgi:hypothetical protein